MANLKGKSIRPKGRKSPYRDRLEGLNNSWNIFGAVSFYTSPAYDYINRMKDLLNLSHDAKKAQERILSSRGIKG